MLKIYLFGTPQIFENDQPVVIRRRLTRTLLFYLAAQGKPESRLALACLFWPDCPEDEARANLRDLLAKLRRDLPDPGIIQTTNETVSLNLHKAQVDYLEFNRLLAEISGPRLGLPGSERITASQYQNMKQMANLWAGQDFFAGYNMPNNATLEHWCTQNSSRVSSQMQAILDRLAEYEYHNGSPENIIHWLSLASRLDEYNDERQARIIETYLRAGMQSQARQYYESIKKFWQSETGDEPPETLTALEPQIYKPHSSSPANPGNHWPIKASTQIPFIGHSEMLETLARAWRSGGAVLILGEAGAGKTRLVQETFQRLTPTPRLLLGTCQPLETNQPFVPWVTMLRNSVQPQTWQDLKSIWAQSLTLLLPELANLRKDVSPALSEKPEISQPVLIEAIHQVLNLLVREGPLFVFIDDTQWADEASLAVISHLLTHQFFSPGRGLLVMVSRSEERNSLLDTLLVTNSPRRIRQLQLSTLELAEIGEMTSYMLGHSVSDSFLERLDRDTGGNPLFLLEVLQSLLDAGLPDDLEHVERLPLPQSVHELIQRRLETIYPDAREVLSTAALLGSHFTLELIETSTHFIPEVVSRAIDELEKARLLQPIPAETPTYGFPHEKIRESLLIGISPARKRFFHQNIARALEQSLGEQVAPQAANLAYHYEQAGNLTKAFQFWVLAGKHAHRLASFHESLGAFERAERLIARTPGLTEQDLYSLYSIWNDALFQSDEPYSLKRVNAALLALGEERQSPLLIGTALSGMSDAYMAENNFEAALKSVQDGLEYVRQSGNNYEMVRTLDRIGVYHYMLNQLPGSQPFLHQSLEISRDSIDSLMVFQRCSTHYQLAITATLSGRPLQGLEYAHKTHKDAIRAYHPYGQVLAYSVMGLSHYLLGDFAEGRKACQLGMGFEHIQAWRMLGYISSYYAMNAAEMGLLGEAWQFGQKAIEIGRRQGHGEVVGLGHKAIGDLYFRLGLDTQAIKSYQQGMTAAGEHFVALENMHRYGYLLFRQGQIAMGKEYLQRALNLSEQSGLWSIHFLASIYDLEILSSEREYQKLEQRTRWLREQSITHIGQDITAYTSTRLKMVRAFEDKDFETVLELSKVVLPWYQQKNIFWRELECLHMLLGAKKSLGQDVALESGRMTHLIKHVDDNMGEAPVKKAWEKQKEQIWQI